VTHSVLASVYPTPVDFSSKEGRRAAITKSKRLNAGPLTRLLLKHQQDLGLTATEVTVLLQIASFGTKHFPRNASLERKTGLGRRQIQRVKQTLKEKGLLVVSPRFDARSNNRQTSSVYDLSPLIQILKDLANNKTPQRVSRDVMEGTPGAYSLSCLGVTSATPLEYDPTAACGFTVDRIQDSRSLNAISQGKSAIPSGVADQLGPSSTDSAVGPTVQPENPATSNSGKGKLAVAASPRPPELIPFLGERSPISVTSPEIPAACANDSEQAALPVFNKTAGAPPGFSVVLVPDVAPGKIECLGTPEEARAELEMLEEQKMKLEERMAALKTVEEKKREQTQEVVDKQAAKRARTRKRMRSFDEEMKEADKIEHEGQREKKKRSLSLKRLEEIWVEMMEDCHDYTPMRWGPKERGQIAHVVSSFDHYRAEWMIRYAISEWKRLQLRFKFMSNKVPTISFVITKREVLAYEAHIWESVTRKRMEVEKYYKAGEKDKMPKTLWNEYLDLKRKYKQILEMSGE